MASTRAPVLVLVAFLGAGALATWLVAFVRVGEPMPGHAAPAPVAMPPRPTWLARSPAAPPAPSWGETTTDARGAAATIHGRVVDARGEPVDGASLFVLELDDVANRGVLDDALLDTRELEEPDLAADPEDTAALGRTAADGTFVLPLLVPLVGTVVACAEGMTCGVSDVAYAGEGTDSAVSIAVRPAGVARGVVASDDGLAVGAIAMELTSGEASWVMFDVAEDGRFRIEHLPRVPWLLSAYEPRWAPLEQPITLDRETRVSFRDRTLDEPSEVDDVTEPEMCVPSLDALRLHGRAILVWTPLLGTAPLDRGAVVLAIDGQRIVNGELENLPRWRVLCAEGTDASVTVAARPGAAPVIVTVAREGV